eukprot:CAMPEP_0170805180 /NCGR_PEP_ID=MMETSP0733-20121128/31222_1 /TAXON_ID=186038 /ORGANISM="Fragilariopsis kerguelensis, Strain L26-C5" /LENGTH=124 /DNA_ID=CAMNT_0011159523 /DNA_START=127 /DNA_END=501 /DNA_ORIENTATION=-
MTPLTSNYETIKETSLEDKSLDTPSQGKVQSTFLQSVLSNKLVVAFVVVVLGTGLMAYNTYPVPPSNQFRLGEYAAIVDGSKGGGFTGTKNGGASNSGSGNGIAYYRDFGKNGNKSKNPNKNSN